MILKEPKKRRGIDENRKLLSSYSQFAELLEELRKKELPEVIINSINYEVDKINLMSESEKKWVKQLKKAQSRILTLLEKELKLVTKNHYRNMWFGVGSAFGFLFGTALGTSLGYLAFLSLGLPIGMIIGIAVGMEMDKKAFEQGMQIPLEIKH